VAETSAGEHFEASDAAITAQAQRFRARQVESGDFVLYCLPANEPILAEDIAALEQLPTERTLLVWTKWDLSRTAEPGSSVPRRLCQYSWVCTSAVTGEGVGELRQRLVALARSLAASDPLAVSLGRCQHHVRRANEALSRAETLLQHQESPEFIAIELRSAMEELGAVLGEVYTEDLLDRIFSRFCIGK
jgi:tRNA modification GTPase